MSWLAMLDDAAKRRERRGLRRELHPRGEDDELIDLAGNDYLGLSRHPEVVAAASAAVKACGLGSTGSRLVRGSTELHATLEAALAEFFGCEAALVYSSGYLANLGAVRAFGGSLIASDAHNHASLVDACRLARSEPVLGHEQAAGGGGGRTVIYPHADPAALAVALGEPRPDAPALALTESVFSVFGDLAPLGALHAAAREHGAVLCVDDAHAVGVIGPSGRGGVALAGLGGERDVVMTSTLSKALGAAGGVVAGPAAYIEHLVQTSRSFIFDTGLAPALAAGALAALELIRGRAGDLARAELADRARSAHDLLRDAGHTVAEPAGAILPVRANGAAQVVAWAAACRSRGVAVGCFRPPSTPDGGSWLRLTINSGIARHDFDRALRTVLDCAREVG